MKITLGLNSHHADSSACLFLDNELVFAIEEERLNRVKHWGGLPTESIRLCLKYGNIKLDQITDLTINTNPASNLSKKIFFFLKKFIFGQKKYEIFKRFEKKINLKFNIENQLNDKFNKSLQIHYIDHHLSHIASAYYPSKFDDAVALSVDGFGDFCSIAIAKCKKKDIKFIDKYYFPNSLGLLYEAFTQFIGFRKYGDEYKMMGLSSYGDPIYYEIIKKKIFFNYEKKILNLKYFNHIKKDFKYNFEGQPNQELIFNNNVFLICEDFKNMNEDVKKNIAASIQKIFEEQLLSLIYKISSYKISTNLVYSGGCALNSLANKKIIESNLFQNLFIPYAPGDGGGSIGSALYHLRNYFLEFKNLKNPYIGKQISYQDEEIEIFLKKNENLNNFKIKKFKSKLELSKHIAKKIYENNIVGFYNGNMEFGARALGNRSILANPCNPKMKEILNDKIKKRENFRPFAPSILLDKKFEWFNNSIENPYMSWVEKINEDKRKFIPAVTHIDGTGRVQTVSKDLNEDFYNLIYQFYKISNVPILLNTSFNENEPIVRRPEEAISCFLRTEMDILVLENFVVERN